MTHFPSILILLAHLAQAPESPAPVAPAEPQPKETVSTETEGDKFVRAAAEKIDGIEYLSATVRQTIRAGGKPIVSTGVYRRGPNYRSRFELDVDLGKVMAKRVHASDGKTGVVYEKMMETESIESFQIGEVMQLVESRELPAEYKRQLLLRLPFVKPGDMLRGYLETIRFDQMTETTLGEKEARPVTLVEGSWREEAIPVIAQNGNIKKVEDLFGSTPQFARLYLDKETSFPLKIELYRRDKQAEYKPTFTLEFLEVASGKIADSEFTFVPPEKVRSVDVTTTLVAQLNQFPAKEKKEGEAAPGKQEVTQPLSPAGK